MKITKVFHDVNEMEHVKNVGEINGNERAKTSQRPNWDVINGEAKALRTRSLPTYERMSAEWNELR